MELFFADLIFAAESETPSKYLASYLPGDECVIIARDHYLKEFPDIDSSIVIPKASLSKKIPVEWDGGKDNILTIHLSPLQVILKHTS